MYRHTNTKRSRQGIDNTSEITASPSDLRKLCMSRSLAPSGTAGSQQVGRMQLTSQAVCGHASNSAGSFSPGANPSSTLAVEGAIAGLCSGPIRPERRLPEGAESTVCPELAL